MGASLGEHIIEIVGLLTFITILFIGLTKWIVNRTIVKVDVHDSDIQNLWKKLANIEIGMANLENKILKELIEVKSNYTKRFEDVKDTINKNHLISIEKVDDLITKIEKQTQYCFLIQENKKKDEK